MDGTDRHAPRRLRGRPPSAAGGHPPRMIGNTFRRGRARHLPRQPRTSSGPTRARRTLLRLMLVLSVVTYFDRVAISSASPAIIADLQLTAIQMGWAFSAFTFAYAA